MNIKEALQSKYLYREPLMVGVEVTPYIIIDEVKDEVPLLSYPEQKVYRVEARIGATYSVPSLARNQEAAHEFEREKVVKMILNHIYGNIKDQLIQSYPLFRNASRNNPELMDVFNRLMGEVDGN